MSESPTAAISDNLTVLSQASDNEDSSFSLSHILDTTQDQTVTMPNNPNNRAVIYKPILQLSSVCNLKSTSHPLRRHIYA